MRVSCLARQVEISSPTSTSPDRRRQHFSTREPNSRQVASRTVVASRDRYQTYDVHGRGVETLPAGCAERAMSDTRQRAVVGIVSDRGSP